MPNQTLKVVARITAQPEKVEQVSSILLSLLEPTRQEQGCIGYQLLQNRADPSDFTFVEEWTSDAALDAHLTTPHVHNAISKLESLLAEAPDARRYAVIG